MWESLYFELILLIQPMNSSMSLFWISNVNVMTDEPYIITENVYMYILEDILLSGVVQNNNGSDSSFSNVQL